MKKKTKKSIVRAVAIATPIVLFSVAAFYNGLTVMNYKIQTEKLTKPIRIVLIADLHGFVFGKNQSKAINAIKKQNPDIVVLAGDIFVEYRSYDGPVMLLDGIAKLFPCYFVSGNHEFLSEDADGIKKIVRDCGVEVLECNCKEVTVNGQSVNICGLEDPYVGKAEFGNQLQNLSVVNTERYSILLSHRAEIIDKYEKLNFDLILTGHAHGGQWRIPFFVNGFFAPDQGFFPDYAGGLYKYNDTVQIVSRGLCKSDLVPRIFNPPELVVIDIEPK
ncbi:MAG: metallophosphoesterase [Eubacteriales bacterium]